jgi:hypothetical protein
MILNGLSDNSVDSFHKHGDTIKKGPHSRKPINKLPEFIDMLYKI